MAVFCAVRPSACDDSWSVAAFCTHTHTHTHTRADGGGWLALERLVCVWRERERERERERGTVFMACSSCINSTRSLSAFLNASFSPMPCSINDS